MKDLAEYLVTLTLTGAILFIAYSFYAEMLTELIERSFGSLR